MTPKKYGFLKNPEVSDSGPTGCHFMLAKMVNIAGVKMTMRCSIFWSLRILSVEDWRCAIFNDFGATAIALYAGHWTMRSASLGVFVRLRTAGESSLPNHPATVFVAFASFASFVASY